MPIATADAKLVERFRADLDQLLPASDTVDPNVRLGVALSGGPDSSALLILAAGAAPQRVAALTVDHQLRPESGAEAEQAGMLAAGLGVPHRIARVSVERRASLQAAARAARYAALAQWAGEEGLGAVLTAHHADDQAETLLMRLARGAGVAGLAGIRPARPLSPSRPEGVWLLRPLLGWRKAELEAIVAAAGIEPIRDRSNEDERYDRTAARRLLADTEWLDPRRLVRSAHHLREAEEAIAWAVERLADKAVRSEGEEAILSPGYPPEIERRLLLRLFAERFGAAPEGPAVERALAALRRGETVMLADILCRPAGPEWRFRRAPPRRSR